MIYKGIKYVKNENCFYVITLFYYLLMLCIASDYQPWTFLIFRIPIFLIGVFVAEKHSGIYVSWAFILFLIGILVYIFKIMDVESNNRVWLFSVANSSLFALITGVVFVRLIDIKLGLFVKLLSFIGKMSYELFLVQILFIRLQVYRYLSLTLMLICIFLVSIILHYIVDFVLKKYSTIITLAK